LRNEESLCRRCRRDSSSVRRKPAQNDNMARSRPRVARLLIGRFAKAAKQHAALKGGATSAGTLKSAADCGDY
jgi:hypothetical protein